MAATYSTWVDAGDESDLRRIDPQTGEVLEKPNLPHGVYVSGLESDGGDEFYCGGGKSGKGRAVNYPGNDLSFTTCSIASANVSISSSVV